MPTLADQMEAWVRWMAGFGEGPSRQHDWAALGLLTFGLGLPVAWVVKRLARLCCQ